jgi:hypothetical protein
VADTRELLEAPVVRKGSDDMNRESHAPVISLDT